VLIVYLSSLGPIANLLFIQLTLTLTVLLALTSLCRISELAAIEHDSIAVSNFGVKFALSKLRKNQKGPLKSFVLVRLNPESLACPVACMSAYLIKSFDFTNHVFGKTLRLGLKAPHKTVGVSTVVRWIKEVLADSGIDVNLFSAHSTRGSAASKEFASGIPVERILKARNWATESVFSRHYQRPVVEPEPDGLAIVN
jgi:hypothetical protein